MKTATVSGLFFVAALYDGLLGLAFLVAADRIFQWAQVTPPNHVGYVQFPGALLMIFGIMFAAIARRPRENRHLIPYGILLKVAYCGVAGLSLAYRRNPRSVEAVRRDRPGLLGLVPPGLSIAGPTGAGSASVSAVGCVVGSAASVFGTFTHVTRQMWLRLFRLQLGQPGNQRTHNQPLHRRVRSEEPPSVI